MVAAVVLVCVEVVAVMQGAVIGGGLGATIDLDAVPAEIATDAAAWPLVVGFTETPGRFLCAVPAPDAEKFATAMQGLPWAWIGSVRAEPTLEISAAGMTATVVVEQLARAWRGNVASSERSAG